MTREALIEVMARAIDPDKFKFWQLSYDYEIAQSGDADEALAFANWCHNLDAIRQQAEAAVKAAEQAGYRLVAFNVGEVPPLVIAEEAP